MMDFPVKLLVVGYGLAAAIALAVQPSLGVIGALLCFWIGGALLVGGLAFTPGLNRRFMTVRVSDESEAQALAEQLRAWEVDRLADTRATDGSGRADSA